MCIQNDQSLKSFVVVSSVYMSRKRNVLALNFVDQCLRCDFVGKVRCDFERCDVVGKVHIASFVSLHVNFRSIYTLRC